MLSTPPVHRDVGIGSATGVEPGAGDDEDVRVVPVTLLEELHAERARSRFLAPGSRQPGLSPHPRLLEGGQVMPAAALAQRVLSHASRWRRSGRSDDIVVLVVQAHPRPGNTRPRNARRLHAVEDGDTA